MTRSPAPMLFLAALFGFAGGLLSQSPFWSASAQRAQPAIVQAREIRLVDSKGRLWGRLGESPRVEASRGLILYDDDGRERLRLALAREGNGGLVISSAGTAFRAGLTVSAAGIPGLALTDRQGRPRNLLLVDDDGPQIDLYDQAGRIVLGLEVAPQALIRLRESEAPLRGTLLSPQVLNLRSEASGGQALLGISEEGRPRLLLGDADGVVASLPENKR